MDSTRRATNRFLMGTGIAAFWAGFHFIRWMYSTAPDAALETKIWLALFAISILSAVWRIIWYRKHRDYFAEEMDHRRSLAKGSH